MSMLSRATNPQFAGFVDCRHHFALETVSFSLTSPIQAVVVSRKHKVTVRMNTTNSHRMQ